MSFLTAQVRCQLLGYSSHKSLKCCGVWNQYRYESTSKKKTLRKHLSYFFDSLRIHVKGGPGGHGYPQKGGVGGRGGDILCIGKKDMTLKDLTLQFPSRRFAGGPGSDSRLFCPFGEAGKGFTIPVPLGISVISQEGHKIGDINEPNQTVVVARGGDGGNEINGYSAQKGQSHVVTLDLKLIADIGFVGFPNAGKSTLLKTISRARPKIAAYPFTTIRPNVGVIEYPDLRTISLADLPGLIEGAHINVGMGHRFLKHVERTLLLLFVVDLHGFQLGPKYPRRTALETIVLLNKELELYLSDLTEKPAILALNKTDLPGSFPVVNEIRDILNDENKYQKFVDSLPLEFQPETLMKFDQIVPISAAKDINSVNLLKKIVRSSLDVNTENEYSQHNT